MNLRKIMTSKRISQYALAKQSGVSQSAISNYAAGSKTPGGKVLLKLAVALNCTVDDLLREDAEDDTAKRQRSSA